MNFSFRIMATESWTEVRIRVIPKCEENVWFERGAVARPGSAITDESRKVRAPQVRWCYQAWDNAKNRLLLLTIVTNTAAHYCIRCICLHCINKQFTTVVYVDVAACCHLYRLMMRLVAGWILLGVSVGYVCGLITNHEVLMFIRWFLNCIISIQWYKSGRVDYSLERFFFLLIIQKSCPSLSRIRNILKSLIV